MSFQQPFALFSWGILWLWLVFFCVTSVKVVLWSLFQLRCLNEVMILNCMHTLVSMAPHYYQKESTNNIFINDFVCHFYSFLTRCLWGETILLVRGSGIGFKIMLQVYGIDKTRIPVMTELRFFIDNVPFSFHPLVKLKHNSTTAKKKIGPVNS